MASESAILSWMLALPVAGGAAILALPEAQAKWGRAGARAVALAVCTATLIVAAMAADLMDWRGPGGGGDMQLVMRGAILRAAGIEYAVGVDGLSMPLVLLTAAMGMIACWASYAIKRSVKIYFALFLFWLSGTLGIFVATDRILFCACLLFSLVTLFFLIAGWGGDRARTGAWKFFWFAAPGVMAVLTAVIASGRDTGHREAWFWVMFAGLAAWVPLVGVHRWLVIVLAESAAPVALLVVTAVQTAGAYGIIRLCYPLFAPQAEHNALAIASLGALTMAYGALGALAQKELRRMAAYASVAQMGFVLLGLAGHTPAGAAGAAYLLIGHAVAMGMVVYICGMIRERVGHCQIERLGGLAGHMPAFAGWGAVGFLAAMGMPGLCVFVGEFLVLMGTFDAGAARSAAGSPANGWVWLAMTGAAVMAVLASCFVWTYQRVFLGPPRPEHSNVARMSMSEKWILAVFGIAAAALGVLPSLITEPMRGAVEGWIGGK